MSITPDASKIIASTLTDLIKSSFNSVSFKATGAIKDTWKKLFEDFEPFMNEVYQRNNFIRLLSQKEKDVELYDVYVGSNFKCSDKLISDDDLIYHIREGKNVVINGNGGAGKTFFMRHLWLTLLKNPMGLTPIFIELRKLNELSKIDLGAFVRRSISRKKELDDGLFSYFCEQGRFCFVLDGYDEVVQSQREALQAQVLELSATYPKCRFVVSSRYERRFAGWQSFELFESVPFTLEQVRDLVAKVPFDEASKKLFLKQLNAEFYRENKSFLSNPLLAIMMMMTFKENMEIPKRMNIFYDQAFTTLYQWHDATKAFSRPKTLDIDDFQKSFAVFCLLSYYKEKFEFTKTEVVDFIRQSNKICGIDKKVEDILLDYEESVNLLKQEGLVYVFIHRSFQEYFAAYAMMHIIPGKFGELLPGIKRRFNDSVLAMCYEMNRGIVVENYIGPVYDRLKSAGKISKTGDGDLYFYQTLGVKYNCHVGVDKLSKGRPLFGMGLQIDDEFSEFLNNVSRIWGVKTYSRDFSSSMIFGPNIFGLFENVLRKAKFKFNCICTVSFEKGDVGVTVNDLEATGADSSASCAIMVEELRKLLATFRKTEESLSKEIKKLAAWCKSEVEQNSKRQKSLDEILSL